LAFALLFGVVFAACGSDGGGSADPCAATLRINLEVADGAVINEVEYEITGNDMEPMGGVIDTSAPGSTASVETFGIPPGQGYVITMTAASVDAALMCGGAATFDVAPGVSTHVDVILHCKASQQFGGVRVNGKLNICAELDKVIVAPLQTSGGYGLAVSAEGSDEEGDPVAFRWTATGGSFDDASAADTVFNCNEARGEEITVEVSDDEFEHCADSWTVPVTCVDESTGGDGGSSGGGSGGAGGVGGSASGACVTDDNLAVYESLGYTDEDGVAYTGAEASAAISTDCVFGTLTSDPVLSGCANEAVAVLNCYPGCPTATTDALASCVTQCTQDATGLSATCAACEGDRVACRASFCISACVADLSAPACIECQCDNSCIQSFDQCSGLPSGGECGTGGTGGMGGMGGETAEYGFTCVLSGLPIPLPVTITIHAEDPGFVAGSTTTLTAQLNYSVAPAVIDLLPDLAPNALVDVVDAVISISGGMPTSILFDETAPPNTLPFAPVGLFESMPVMTPITPSPSASQVALSVDAFTARVIGIPESLLPDGVLTLTANEGDCGGLEALNGSGPLTFELVGNGVADAGKGSGGSGGAIERTGGVTECRLAISVQ
jgi:hypothetical protein